MCIDDLLIALDFDPICFGWDSCLSILHKRLCSCVGPGGGTGSDGDTAEHVRHVALSGGLSVLQLRNKSDFHHYTVLSLSVSPGSSFFSISFSLLS